MSFLKPEVIFRNTTRLYYSSSNITYILQKQPIKVQIFRLTKFKFLMSFFKQKSIFLQNLDHSSLLRKAAHQSANFQTYHLKFTKFLMSFLEPRISFSSNFASLFSVMRHNSFVLFHLNLCMLWTKGFDHSANFQTFDSSHEN